MEWSLYFVFIVLFVNVISGQRFPYDGGENEFTITITPNALECFYQTAKVGNTLELEYQVWI